MIKPMKRGLRLRSHLLEKVVLVGLPSMEGNASTFQFNPRSTDDIFAEFFGFSFLKPILNQLCTTGTDGFAEFLKH
jgi:hypothetical protein